MNEKTSALFEPLKLRGVTLRNRIAMSPMCMYSAVDGKPQPWHMAHLGARAVGGVGLVLTEATAVEPIGRISPNDTGIWNDNQVEAWRPIVRFIEEQGAVPGIQIAHAGRKASTRPPWESVAPIPVSAGGWRPVAPSELAFSEQHTVPKALSEEEIVLLTDKFIAAVGRAKAAGFKVIELHMAHGYLLHSFLSPLTNRREDGYGGTLANRMKLPIEIAEAVRAAWPEELPLLVRISATDWVDGGWTVEDSLLLAKVMKEVGIDVIDCSSGGLVTLPKGVHKIDRQPEFAARIRRESGMKVAAVGGITEPGDAEKLIRDESADLVVIGRALLRDPYWPLHAAHELGVDVPWPRQYLRAKPR